MQEQPARSYRVRQVLSVVLALSGLVWIDQGLGYINGSVMTDDRKWVLIGAALVVFALMVVRPSRNE